MDNECFHVFNLQYVAIKRYTIKTLKDAEKHCLDTADCVSDQGRGFRYKGCVMCYLDVAYTCLGLP